MNGYNNSPTNNHQGGGNGYQAPDTNSDYGLLPNGVLGQHYLGSPSVKADGLFPDKTAVPESRKKLKLIGGVAASLALTLTLVGTACNKVNNDTHRQAYIASQIGGSSDSVNPNSGSTTPEPKQETDPNMNTETADSEHDGKISYQIYEYEPYSPNTDCLVPVGEHSSQVDYDSSDTVDDRKETSLSDLAEYIAKRNENDPSSTKFTSINDVFAKGEDYHGHNAIADMLKKYGGYDHFKFKTSDYHVLGYDGNRIVHEAEYHCSALADADPNIVDGVISISIFNPDDCKEWEHGYSGRYVIRIPRLFSNEKHGGEYGRPFYGGMIVCDHMPTEKELIQIIKDNYSSLFKMTDKFSDPISTNRDTMARIKYDKQKP